MIPADKDLLLVIKRSVITRSSQMMSGHGNLMNSMMSQMQSGSMFGGFDEQQQQQLMRSGGNGGGSSSYNFMSSSSSSSNRGGVQSVSTSTRTSIVNGVRKTIKERTVVHPDGRKIRGDALPLLDSLRTSNPSNS